MKKISGNQVLAIAKKKNMKITSQEEAETEARRLLAEAKELIKQAAEIASHYPVDMEWQWENVYNHYLYCFKVDGKLPEQDK